jgi:hypothetical protein
MENSKEISTTIIMNGIIPTTNLKIWLRNVFDVSEAQNGHEINKNKIK